MDLKTMKRRELQKLCKAHSIKANMKNTEMIQERRREMLEEKKTMIEDEAVVKTREQDSDIMESAAAAKEKEVIEENTMGEEQNELAEPEGAELTLNSTYTIEPSTESSSTSRQGRSWALDYDSAVKDSPLLRNSHLLHARKDSPLLLARLAEKENTSPHNALRQVDKEQEPDYCTSKIPVHRHDALKKRITYEVEHREGSCVTCRLPDKSKLFRVSV